MTIPTCENAGDVTVNAAIASAAVRSRDFQFDLVCKVASFDYNRFRCHSDNRCCPSKSSVAINKPTSGGKVARRGLLIAQQLAAAVFVLAIFTTFMIFAVPMALVIMPAIVVAIVVRVAPVAACVRWSIPTARYPIIASVSHTPISIHPGITFARGRRSALITHRWRSAANDDSDLCRSRCGDCGESRSRKCCSKELQLHIFYSLQ